MINALHILQFHHGPLEFLIISYFIYTAAVAQSIRALISHVEGWVFETRDKSKSLKQIATSSHPNARQQVWVSRVLGDDYYKGFARVTVVVAR